MTKNIRYGPESDKWDEADGIIALATVDDNEEDIPTLSRRESLHRQQTWPTGASEADYVAVSRKTSNAGHRHSVVLSPGDDIFGHHTYEPQSPTLNCRPSAATFSQGRKVVDKNDPIEVAKNMMEKMQKHRASKLGQSTGMPDGKTPFDTDMLQDLVVHVSNLRRELTAIVDAAKQTLKLKHDLTEGPCEDPFDFEISPITGSFDDAFPRTVQSAPISFRPTAIGIAT